jgi:hypothetical protein
MFLLDYTYIRDAADYSFGDESGSKLPYGYMKPANNTNKLFLVKLKAHKKPYMTLFIDNIRLYARKARYTAIEQVRPDWKVTKDKKLNDLADQDLLALCASFPDMDFIIFSGFEDTPIDEQIFDRIPKNVKAIYACNATSFGGKVHPMPYGLQRKLHHADDRLSVIASMLEDNIQPSKLLYCNYSLFTNPYRTVLNDHFQTKPWATVKQPNAKYFHNYLIDIKTHKFVLCPSGNAIGCDCHRDWETIYMRRIPVLERNPYLEVVFKGFPVLFVDNFMDITEDLLKQNEYLLEKATRIDWRKLDIKYLFQNIIHDTDLSYQSAPENRQVAAEH